jgi:hypothetical protein
VNERPEDGVQHVDAYGNDLGRAEPRYRETLVCPYPDCRRDGFRTEPSRQRHLNAHHGGLKYPPLAAGISSGPPRTKNALKGLPERFLRRVRAVGRADHGEA